MRKVKIFKIGSCRTSISKYIDDNNFECEYNYDLTHTTKEILMYIDILNGDLELKNIPHPECLIRDYDKFKIKKYKKLLDEADILLVETSSLKLVKKNSFFYQIERFNETNTLNTLNGFEVYVQTEEDFKNDVEKIYNKISKPITFVPHITIDFDKETKSKSGENLQTGNLTLNKTRQTIEDYVVRNTKYNVKTSEIFKDYHYSEICDCSKKFDPNHYTDLGYTLLSKKIQDEFYKIINENNI